ncbi:bifunctional nicotinamide-nucleotide adenylyltransferase/Nudix hydroxylase [Verminephrobacter eiseniae]|uniref:Cytidyltransferase-related domain n=1 Tax=Verminephrobacter eiseniae (strain EF01-2) TaxID=391735 RepID=A1WSC9_VEREI|nr:bifunctional nicotinamide-nucleotide adenylyltransferase/Nudix hydroxylase [Verminephrobacter eiseniae]ABM60536.1 cytidyltransferase-related domain [Verminephrobacter eiseniae EF01-2]MCW5260791.1 NUDIX domain-containing protein [Verminephrobacter eiseniae]MCW5286012.1 NUDIX domain-containing protein [Verminephrobacter eiseniae]MCW5304310.1 NUDIX domain-containing protein [Verminephrobacter eiseniae]MCW8180503.1 NUDIX domain-containing protein [Verminephrobacter eiseniae]
MHDTAIYIGRFQPVHNGHRVLLQRALASARQVIVVLGSAWQARSPKNPFTWQEREAMLRAVLPDADQARVQLLPVRDYYNQAVWVQAVHRAVAPFTAGGARIGLVGHFKDATSSYLSAFPDWELMPVQRQGRIDASAIRDAYLGATPASVRPALAALADEIPASTLAALECFAQTPPYLALQQEWRMLRDYRQAWAAAPWPPVFVTVAAVLRCQDQVLLIGRAHAPGKGLLALPGGFLGPRETLWQSCLRALREQTRCPLPEARLRAALQSVAVFDHPDRSQRGRSVTHTHCFDLEDAPLPVVMPAVPADGDARPLQWTPIAQLAGLEEAFFEDHFHMLDHFLSVTSPPPMLL